MDARHLSRIAWRAALAIILWAFISQAQAGPPEELEKLGAEFHAKFEAGWYSQAEELARRRVELAKPQQDERPLVLAECLFDLGRAASRAAHYEPAMAAYRQAIELRSKALGEEHAGVAEIIDAAGEARLRQARFRDAQLLLAKALELREKSLASDDAAVAESAYHLALLDLEVGRRAQAEKRLARVRNILEKSPDEHRAALADVLGKQGMLERQQGRLNGAEGLWKMARELRLRQFGEEHPEVATSIYHLALIDSSRGRYAEAEANGQRALAMRKKFLGDEHPLVAELLTAMAYLRMAQGRYAEAKQLFQQAADIDEQALGADHPTTAGSLHGLAMVFEKTGHYAEAEAQYQRVLGVRQRVLGPNHLDTAASMNGLAIVQFERGRFAEAEPLFERALAIYEKAFPGPQTEKATILGNLGRVALEERRPAEAEARFRKALAMHEQLLGPDHPTVGVSLNALAMCLQSRGRIDEAEALYRRLLTLREKALGAEHHEVASVLSRLAGMYANQNRYADAEPLLERAREIYEHSLGPEHPYTAGVLSRLASLRVRQDRPAEAEPLLDRAITIQERAQVGPESRASNYFLRAQIGWQRGRRSEAVLDLRTAMDLVEQQRLQISGAEQERAVFFSATAGAYETMLAWQTEAGDAVLAFDAMERGRARSLFDELAAARVDLDVGRTPGEREASRRRQTELEALVTRREEALAKFETQRVDERGEDVGRGRQSLEQSLIDARRQLYILHRDLRGTSQVYQHVLAGYGAPRLSQFQRHLAAEDGLALLYLIGSKGGYVLVIDDGGARVESLALDDAAASVLGTTAGPLTAERLRLVLAGKNADGLLAALRDPAGVAGASTRLELLWRVLVPEETREKLVDEKTKRLYVVPDGPLALLPFEALVVHAGDDPRYLLDVGPPVVYGPSATVLIELADRGRAAGGAIEPLLTVGDPRYPNDGRTAEPSANGRDAATRAAKRVGRGKLAPLPYSGDESRWVAAAFAEQGQSYVQLLAGEATEANVRSHVAGRRLVHLACHGMAEESFGNFFGALALTPGEHAADDPADDGYLTLAEIYALDLHTCELAIASACETNDGPRQQGEGVWSLSRGFLVAGARRVVASNWLLDDEASASLVSYFCALLAKSEKEGRAIDYARALRTAKRWVRQQEKWRSPAYWAALVLIGPD